MVEPVRHRRTKGAATDMFEPKATASHLDSTQSGRSPKKLSRARSALPLARYAPDHIANSVRHQNGAVGTECYPYRSSIGHPLVRCEEPRQNIPRWPSRAPVRERHEDDLVATQRAAVPGAVPATEDGFTRRIAVHERVRI